MEQKRNYAGFISYRHVSRDQQIARALQFLLENNLLRPDKTFPRHIRPVFLDTSELTTAEDLNDRILQALDRSEFLFVICSPDLPKSKYCMREITWFKEKHGGSLERVALLLVRGEPEESIPRELKTKTVPDPDRPGEKREVEIEPLFADVRSKTLLGALWKLFKTEYVRLAARYFGCSFDALKKRHRKNMITALTAALILALSLTGAMVHKDQQMRITQANAYASYANEQTVLGDELKALALCTHTECKETHEYTVALRNAVVQLDYKKNNVPVSKVLEMTYENTQLTNYYISASGDMLVVADGNIWQLSDAENGTLIRQFPYESAFVPGGTPAFYAVMESRKDQKNEFYDWVVMRDLVSDATIAEFPFRKSSLEETDYHLISLAESGSKLFMLMDGETEVAYFDHTGTQLTREEFIEQALTYQEVVLKPEQPWLVVRDKLHKQYVVKDDAGNVVLELGESYDNSAFSEDSHYFAWAADGMLSVCDTETWTVVSQIALRVKPQSIHMLRGSGYCIIGYRDSADSFLGDRTKSAVIDWRTGETYLTFDGTALISPVEQAFFTVGGGKITRYVYSDLDTAHRSRVIAHSGKTALSVREKSWILRDTASGQILLTLEGEEVFWDETLEYILCRKADRLACYDNSGKTLWYTEQTSLTAAISPDGSRCAWMDMLGAIHIVDTKDGTEVTRIEAEAVEAAGNVTQLLVSGEEVCVIGDEETLWLAPNAASVRLLGKFDAGTLFSDGMLILERDSRIDDFRIYNTRKDKFVTTPDGNTGAWAYSPATGYLVRQPESAGNNASLQLEISRVKNGKVTVSSTVDLPSKNVWNLRIDSEGKTLSYGCEARSYVYLLDSCELLLNVDGEIYMEGNTLFGSAVYGDYQYMIPLHDTAQLLPMAQDALCGPRGIRTLTEEEQKYYSLS